MSKQAPPPNSALHLLCRTICVATAYSCVRLSPDSPLVVIGQILSCTTVRGSTPFVLYFHIHPWRSPTTPFSVPPAAVWVRTVVASRRSSNSARPTSRVCWASLAALLPVALSQSHRSMSPSTCDAECTPPPHVWLWQTQKRCSGESLRTGTARPTSYFRTATVLLFRKFCKSGGAQIRIKPPSFGVLAMPPLPQTEQRLLIVMHESSHFI